MELFKKLYAEFILSYEEVHANILDDIKFYITILRGAVIYSDGYLMSIPLSEVHAICYRSPHNPLKKSHFFKS